MELKQLIEMNKYRYDQELMMMMMIDSMIKNKQLEYVMNENHLMTKED
jgi:hypothetical protein